MTTLGAKKKNRGRLITVGQAAELLFVHPDTVRRWAARGMFKVYRVGPRLDRRFRRSEIVRLLRDG